MPVRLFSNIESLSCDELKVNVFMKKTKRNRLICGKRKEKCFYGNLRSTRENLARSNQQHIG
jgi:hypothetical protein